MPALDEKWCPTIDCGSDPDWLQKNRAPPVRGLSGHGEPAAISSGIAPVSSVADSDCRCLDTAEVPVSVTELRPVSRLSARCLLRCEYLNSQVSRASSTRYPALQSVVAEIEMLQIRVADPRLSSEGIEPVSWLSCEQRDTSHAFTRQIAQFGLGSRLSTDCCLADAAYSQITQIAQFGRYRACQLVVG